MFALLDVLLRRIVRHGDLTVTDAARRRAPLWRRQRTRRCPPPHRSARSSVAWCAIRNWRWAKPTWTAGWSCSRAASMTCSKLVLSNAQWQRISGAGPKVSTPPAISSAACCSSIRRGGRSATWPTTTTSTAPSTTCSSTRDRQYSCGYFEDTDDLDDRPARQEAPHRRQARHRAGPARARHRLGLGRPRVVSRQDRRLRRDRRHAQRRAAQDLAGARRQGGPRPLGALRVQGLPQGHRPVRPHRLGRHVRARRRQPLRHLLPQGARAAGRRTASR